MRERERERERERGVFETSFSRKQIFGADALNCFTCQRGEEEEQEDRTCAQVFQGGQWPSCFRWGPIAQFLPFRWRSS